MTDDRVVYIAGALSGTTPQYIQNLHKMSKYTRKVQKTGLGTYNPGNDFIDGVVNGDMEYNNFISNSIKIMLHCDAIALVPGNWENSMGTRREILEARRKGIPVLYNFNEVLQYKKGKEMLG